MNDGLTNHVGLYFNNLRFENFDLPDEFSETRQKTVEQKVREKGVNLQNNSLFQILKYWSMGSRQYPITPEHISQLVNLPVSHVAEDISFLDLIDWTTIDQPQETFGWDFYNNGSKEKILVVGSYRGEDVFELSRGNLVRGVDFSPYFIETSEIRTRFALPEEIKSRSSFFHGDFLSLDDSLLLSNGKFDRICMFFPQPGVRSSLVYESNMVLAQAQSLLSTGGRFELVTEIKEVFDRYTFLDSSFRREFFDSHLSKSPVSTPYGRNYSNKYPERKFYHIELVKK